MYDNGEHGVPEWMMDARNENDHKLHPVALMPDEGIEYELLAARLEQVEARQDDENWGVVYFADSYRQHPFTGEVFLLTAMDETFFNNHVRSALYGDSRPAKGDLRLMIRKYTTRDLAVFNGLPVQEIP